MKLRPDRRAAAAAVLIAWIAGIALLAHRRHSRSDAELLARGALTLDPATYFYTVSQDSEQIGSASSSIDTSATGFTVREVARLRTPIAGGSQSMVASSTAYLSRGLALDSFSVTMNGKHPLHDVNAPAAHSGILLPTLAPIALMLTREPRVGFTTTTPIYNPIGGSIERVTMRIAAESLFSVVDSAVFDSAQHRWMAAHLDTVRSWKIVAPSRGISAWVDSRGRLVAASAPSGASILRTAYEIATLNPKLPTH